jgi:hypothetical protein
MPLVLLVDGRFEPIGTAFVISFDGHMLTASHNVRYLRSLRGRVFERSLKEYVDSGEVFTVYRAKDETVRLWPVERLWAHYRYDFVGREVGTDGDIAVLKLVNQPPSEPQQSLTRLKLRPAAPAQCERIKTAGYDVIEGTVSEDVATERLTVVGYRDHLAARSGIVESVHSGGHEMYKFPGFRTDALMHPGMSGGPIFDANGFVCGVVSGGDRERNYGAAIWPALGAGLERTSRDGVRSPCILIDLIADGLVMTDGSEKGYVVIEDQGGARTIRRTASPEP